MQERFCPDFKDKVGEKKKNKIIKSLSPSLFDIATDKEIHQMMELLLKELFFMMKI